MMIIALYIGLYFLMSLLTYLVLHKMQRPSDDDAAPLVLIALMWPVFLVIVLVCLPFSLLHTYLSVKRSRGA